MAIDQAKNGRSPSGRATHERSRVAPSPPSVGVPNAAQVVARLSHFVDDPAYDIGMVRGVMRDARDLLAMRMAQDAEQERRLREYEAAGLCWRNPAPDAAAGAPLGRGGTVRISFAASAIEARSAETGNTDSARQGESAGPQDDAQPQSEASE